MKAYVYGARGAKITDVAKPAPKGTQVLVRVRACGLNRADLGMTKGHTHGSAGGAGTVLGMEWAGEIAELGPEAKGVKIGDRVMGSGGGAFAEDDFEQFGRWVGHRLLKRGVAHATLGIIGGGPSRLTAPPVRGRLGRVPPMIETPRHAPPDHRPSQPSLR